MTYDNTPAQVVVIEEGRRKRSVLPWIAGAAALVLLTTGGTFALWRASATFTGGQVTAGDLDLTGCDQLTWYDVSPDRRDADVDLSTVFSVDFATSTLFKSSGDGSIRDLALAQAGSGQVYTGSGDDVYPTEYTTFLKEGKVYGHKIDDISKWRMVPADTVIAVCQNALMTLEGDNLVAELQLIDNNGDEITGMVIGDDGAGHTWDGVVTGVETIVNGAFVNLGAGFPGSDGSLGFFGAPNDGQEQGIASELNPWLTAELHAKTNTYTDAIASTAVDLRLQHCSDNSARIGFTFTDADCADTATLAVPTPGSGRMSLGQGYVSTIFAVHFLDDGIDEDAVLVPAHCSDNSPLIGDAGSDEDCDGAATLIAEAWVPASRAYTDKNNGDAADEENSRYLATEVLAKLEGARLVLKQVRENAGAFATPTPTL